MGRYLEYVEGSFTDEHYAKQDYSNYPYVAYSVADDKVIYTIMYNGVYYTLITVEKTDISGLTYNEVDLGLPSGVKWADRNIGADAVEDNGCYFAWGETTGYKYMGVQKFTAGELAEFLQPLMYPDPAADDYVELTEDNIGDILADSGIEGTDISAGFGASIMGGGNIGFVEDGKQFIWDDYFDTTDSGSTFTKYSTSALTVLEATDDAAAVNMGGDWRMPTYEEFVELINNTTPTFIDLDGNEFTVTEIQDGAIAAFNLKGMKLTGTNGNSIFLPAHGYCNEFMLGGMAYGGVLWSSSLYSSNSKYARCLGFNYDGYLDTGDDYRCSGLPVRGIK